MASTEEYVQHPTLLFRGVCKNKILQANRRKRASQDGCRFIHVNFARICYFRTMLRSLFHQFLSYSATFIPFFIPTVIFLHMINTIIYQPYCDLSKCGNTLLRSYHQQGCVRKQLISSEICQAPWVLACIIIKLTTKRTGEMR
jgi:hypothetical protein